VKYYGKVGQSIQEVLETTNPEAPEGYIEMVGERPSDPKYVARTDGTWGLTALTPEEEQAAATQKRLDEIAARLVEIDLASVRPLRAIAQGSATAFDHEKLAALEKEAADLREERAALLP
jgi:hypothetical protein